MSLFEIVAIGASAGGVKAINSVLGDMPKNFSASIVIVQHIDPEYKSRMAEILQWNCKMKVKEAKDGNALKPGVVYIAPPNKHMLVKDKKIALTTTPPVNFSRPSIDLLFNSVATTFGDRVIGVILTGTGKDGSEGIKAIKKGRGITIAQDEKTSKNFDMPRAAIDTGAVDFILPIHDIGRTILALMAVPEE
jgi:two-component system chemotaxis response regulator CheB